MKIQSALIVALLVTSCASYEPSALALEQGMRAAPPKNKASVEEAVKAYFAQSLFDPYSAQYDIGKPINSWQNDFGDVSHGWFVCGTINAKNRLGGYVGASPFWAHFNPADPDRVASGYLYESGALLASRNCKQIIEHQTGIEWKPVETE